METLQTRNKGPNPMATAPAISDRPVAEPNTTPLIDVLLVLLILLVLTAPAATNVMQVDVGSCDFNCPPIQRDHNDLTVTAGGLTLWNGQVVTPSQLDSLLASTRKIRPEPELRFAPDGGASYEATTRVLLRIKASGVTAFGFVGNENYMSFDRPRR